MLNFQFFCLYIHISSAKHLHSPDEQLHSLAGSFGYVAPEVLKKAGHGKAVDIWAIGYVDHLSCMIS